MFQPRKYPRILIVGPGRSGKDEALLWFNKNTPYASGGTTSLYFAYDVAVENGVTAEEAYASRHRDRMFWFNLGNSLRKERGMLYLLNQALMRGNVVAGVRDRAEMSTALLRWAIDVVLWVNNPNVATDPTLTFTYDDIVSTRNSTGMCGKDVLVHVVENKGTLEDYHANLSAAEFAIWNWWADVPDSQKAFS